MLSPAEIAAVAAAAAPHAPLVEQIYKDALSGAIQQFGHAATEIVKAARLATIPFVAIGHLRDRLDRHLEAALAQVPSDRLVKPVDALLYPIAQKLVLEEPGRLAGLYVNLLARAMDKERLGEAHPGFLLVINNLALDELLMLERVNRRGCQIFFQKRMQGPWFSYGTVLDAVNAEEDFSDSDRSWYAEHVFCEDDYAYPEQMRMYLEHLVTMGVLRYSSGLVGTPQGEWSPFQYEDTSHKSHPGCIDVTLFGKLFYSACCRTES
ncbi:Abi-alpha family protein [Variovorax sp. HJSM1_2]|uniref:Abi-alpha family protein n=1 Tax=Variovorax sp. HJSM1_2 TaxID=3366263 RepID=UPI003BCA697B